MIERLDLPNLVTLHVLLDERHVTRAARRLGISQSSMSHRLARLRDALGDPLFVREGPALVPTARASAIAAPLADALRALEASVATSVPFEPKAARFTLEIFLPDLLAPIAPRIVQAVTRAAPGVNVRLTNVVPGLSDALARDTPSIALAPSRFVHGNVVSKSVGQLRFAVVMRRAHPALRRELDLERWLAFDHVVVRIGNESKNVIEDELGRRDLSRRVGLEVPSFLCGLLVVAGSDLLMNAPVPLVGEAARALRLEIRDAPIRLPAIRFAMSWHERFHRDPAHRWARTQVFDAVRPAFA